MFKKSITGYCAGSLFVLCIVLLSMIGCRKQFGPQEGGSQRFDRVAAKEYWYGVFRKSAAYRTVSQRSPITATNTGRAEQLGALAEAGTDGGVVSYKMYPSWKNGREYAVGDVAIAEFPVFAERKVVLIPEQQKLGAVVRRRISEAAVDRLLISKANGKVSVRLLSIVPDSATAHRMHYDLSSISANRFPADFSGWIFVKTWSQDILHIWEVRQGKITGELQLKPKVTAEVVAPGQMMGGQHCEWVEVSREVRTCISALPLNDDEPENWEDQPCENWQTHTIWDWEYQCTEVNDEQACALQNLTQEQCMCMLYNVGCEPGGEGDGDNPPDPDNPECNFTSADIANIEAGFVLNEMYIVSDEDLDNTITTSLTGEVTRRDSKSWKFLTFVINPFFTSFPQEFTADFSGIAYKTSATDNNWKWKSISFTGGRKTYGTVPVCLSMDYDITSAGEIIYGDHTQAEVGVNYSISVKISCLGNWEALDPRNGTVYTNLYPRQD